MENRDVGVVLGANLGKLLVAIDDSWHASLVMEKVLKLAPVCTDITLLSVVKLPSIVASEGEIDKAGIKSEEDKFLSLHKELIEKYFRQQPVLIESKILHGDPVDKICEYAETVEADLVVLGTRGRGRITATLLGSVAEKVAHKCKRSVLIVKGHKPRA